MTLALSHDEQMSLLVLARLKNLGLMGRNTCAPGVRELVKRIPMDSSSSSPVNQCTVMSFEVFSALSSRVSLTLA